MLKKIVVCLAVVGASEAGFAVAQSEEVPELPAACTQLMPIGKNIIYKGCAGSGHLSKDPRGAGSALIAKKNVALRPNKCMPIFSAPTAEQPQGKKIGAMYLYPFNDPRAYAWRGYSNYVNGCGRGDTRKKIRNRAKNNPIFIKVKGKRCIKINKAWSNINSVQRCDK